MNFKKYIVVFTAFCIVQLSFSQCVDYNVWNESWTSCNLSQSPNSIRGASHWIQYEFNTPVSLGTMHIWNANRFAESSLGAQNVVIDYSVDGTNWTELGNYTFPKADESLTYTGFEGPSFEGDTVYKVLITVLNNHSNDDNNCVSIAEIQFNKFMLDVCITNKDERPENIEAECYDQMSGIKTENATTGTQNVGYINSGDWVMYENIDLTGMKSVSFNVASTGKEGTIELRTESVTGPLLASMPVENTGGWQEWSAQTMNLETTAAGVQKIYLVFTGTTGYLFNIDKINFSKDEVVVTDLEEDVGYQITLYPNPTHSSFHILGANSGSFELYDNMGRVFQSGNIVSDDHTVKTQNLAHGVYFVKVILNRSTTIEQLIIK